MAWRLPLLRRLSDALHVLCGMLAVALRIELPVTGVFLLYQLIDFMSGEPVEDIMRDLVEFGLGLILGALVRAWMF